MDRLIKNKKIIGILLLILIITVPAICNFKFIKASYYNAKYNHYKIGDKMYVTDRFLNDTTHLKMFVERLVISNSKYDLISSSKAISSDSLHKYKTAYIGIYTGYKLVYITLGSKSAFVRLYSIKPNWEIISDDHLSNPPSAGFTYADTKLYIIGTPVFLK